MSDYDKMKISEMRKMVKEHRKVHTTPLGKMSKIALMKEMDKYAGTPSATPSHAPVEVKRTEVSKEVAKREEGKVVPKKKAVVEKVDFGVQGRTSHAPAKEARAEVEATRPVARARLIKGSQESKDFMASIRQKKTKKDNVS